VPSELGALARWGRGPRLAPTLSRPDQFQCLPSVCASQPWTTHRHKLHLQISENTCKLLLLLKREHGFQAASCFDVGGSLTGGASNSSAVTRFEWRTAARVTPHSVIHN